MNLTDHRDILGEIYAYLQHGHSLNLLFVPASLSYSASSFILQSYNKKFSLMAEP